MKSSMELIDELVGMLDQELVELSDAVWEERRKRFIRDKFPSLPKATFAEGTSTAVALKAYRQVVPGIGLLEAKWAVEEMRK